MYAKRYALLRMPIKLQTLDELEKIAKSGTDKFLALKAFSIPGVAENKKALLDILTFATAALSLSKNIDTELRANYKQLYPAHEREQVLKHKISDLWGMVLTLEKSIDQHLSFLETSGSKNEVLANFESLYRITEDTLVTVDKINHGELHLAGISEQISYAFSLVNSSDISKLSNSSLEYLTQLA